MPVFFLGFCGHELTSWNLVVISIAVLPDHQKPIGVVVMFADHGEDIGHSRVSSGGPRCGIWMRRTGPKGNAHGCMRVLIKCCCHVLPPSYLRRPQAIDSVQVSCHVDAMSHRNSLKPSCILGQITPGRYLLLHTPIRWRRHVCVVALPSSAVRPGRSGARAATAQLATDRRRESPGA